MKLYFPIGTVIPNTKRDQYPFAPKAFIVRELQGYKYSRCNLCYLRCFDQKTCRNFRETMLGGCSTWDRPDGKLVYFQEYSDQK